MQQNTHCNITYEITTLHNHIWIVCVNMNKKIITQKNSYGKIYRGQSEDVLGLTGREYCEFVTSPSVASVWLVLVTCPKRVRRSN